MNKIIVLLLCLGLCGCATTAGYEAVLNTWVGNSESSLISSWGSPQNAYVMTNGKRAIEYARSRNMQMGGYTYTEPQTTYHYGNINRYGNFNTYGDVNTYGNFNSHGTYSGTSTQYVTKQTPVYNIPMWCKTTFIISSGGIIESWRWEGNNCKAVAPKQQKPIYETRMGKEETNAQTEIIKQACKDGKIPSSSPVCK